MLRMFHTHRKTVFGILVVCIAAMSMTGFGVNMYQNYEADKVYAIKIDDERVGFMEFDRERRQLQNRYRSMLGQNYAQLAPMLEANLNQQVIDKVISDNLFLKAAQANGLFSGPDELQRIMRSQVFSGGFDAEMYRRFLQEMNLSAPAFEQEVRDSALRAQFVGLFSDVTGASMEEARAMWEQDETTYSVRYVEFDPVKFEGQVDVSNEVALEEFYTTNASDYERPAQVAYDYVVLDPQKFVDLVVPSEEDIEMYYQDNQSRFMNPLEYRARHVQFTYAKGAKAEEMAKTKERAQEALIKIQAGEDFGSVATQYSDDLTSNTAGGDLGFVKVGTLSAEFDGAVAKLAVGAVSELVSTPYGFHIIKLEERKEPEPQKLEVVRATIVKELQLREAPAYTADRAQQLFEEWSKSEGKLSDFASKHGLVAEQSKGLRGVGSDPASNLQGLTERILVTPEVQKQIVEAGELTVLAEIREFKEPTIPPFGEVKADVLAAYRRQESKRLATEAGARMLAALTGDTPPDFAKFAAEQKLSILEANGFSRAKPAAGVIGSPEIQSAIFNTVAPLAHPKKVFEVGGKGYIFQVKDIKKPDTGLLTERLADYKNRAAERNVQILVGSVLAKLKADATIDVDPQLVVRKG
jgi:peptidyl-prolyl cis-trans isomerase D